MRNRVWGLLVLAAMVAGACKDQGGGKPAKGEESAAPAPKPAPAAEPAGKGAADGALVAAVDRCWSMLESWNKDAYLDCFADTASVTYVDNVPPQQGKNRADAVVQAGMFRNAFPDFKAERSLVLAKGSKWVLVARLSGTHKNASLGLPPTGKAISTLWAEVGELGPDGRIASTRNYMDQSTLLHQLGILESETAASAEEPWPAPVRVVARNDDAERANLDAVRQGIDAIGKRDVAGALAMYAENATFRYLPEAKPYRGLSELKGRLTSYVAVSKDFTQKIRDQWAAGNWVVVELTTSGHLSEDLPGVKGTKGKPWQLDTLEIMKLAGGKVVEHWSFANGLKFAADIGLFDPSLLTNPSGEGQ